jgi:WD40 repeat protein
VTWRSIRAAGGIEGELSAPGENVIRVWNLDTRAVQVLEPGDGKPISRVAFMPDGRLLSAGNGGVRLWDLSTKASSTIIDGVSHVLPSPDGRYLLGIRSPVRPGGPMGPALVYDVEQRKSVELTTHGSEVTAIAWHPAGDRVVTGSRDGIVRVGAMTGAEPHLVLGHAAAIWNLEVESGGRWIASASDDGAMRISPMPEGGRPFHTLPRTELLERLRSLTNYRIVADAASASGYRLDFEAFRGWNRKPPAW